MLCDVPQLGTAVRYVPQLSTAVRYVPQLGTAVRYVPQLGTADANIQDPCGENPELKRWSLYIAMHGTPTARDFFLANFYPSDPSTCTFPKPRLSFSCAGCG